MAEPQPRHCLMLRSYDRLPTNRCRVEPPVRIELTTYALQERCSTAELRRPTGLSLSGHSSASITRCDDTVRDDDRLRGRRPGSGIRSAMLLSGLTTWLSVMTASCRASIVGANASSPGASRFNVSATSA